MKMLEIANRNFKTTIITVLSEAKKDILNIIWKL